MGSEMCIRDSPTATAIIVTDGAGDEVKMLAEGDVAPGTPLFKV